MVDNLQNEIWKPIVGYEGLYEISNMGRVKTLARVYYGGIVPVKIKERIRKVQIKRKGYLDLLLSKGGVNKKYTVHRLVAIAFIANPENKPQVNHKNGNPADNTIENLEWCTNQENCRHAWRTLNRKAYPQPKGADNINSKKVYCETFGISFNSTKEARIILGADGTRIGKVCKGILSHVNGLTFRYA